jgi:predicted glycosyltransferase
VKVWIDIENPPQVQYLLPARAALATAGVQTVITARDYGSTVEMLAAAGVDAHVCGQRVGRSKGRKVMALLARSRELVRFLDATGRPDALLAASRPAAVAARWLGIPSFIIGDYEHANLSLYRLTGSTILYPSVIGAEAFAGRGLRPKQLVPFNGLKEDLTFSGLDPGSVEPIDLGQGAKDVVRVLFRPPSETSHYYQEASSTMTAATLAWLAESGALVVFSPREPEQARYLDGLAWRHPPVLLERPVPFLSLLASVDAVVCAGGTMLREAAYLGVPAYTIFQSEIGGVDRWLEQIGRVKVLGGPEDLDQIELVGRGPLQRLDGNPKLVEELVSLIVERTERKSRKFASKLAVVEIDA